MNSPMVSLKVQDIMSAHPHTVDEETPLENVFDLFVSHHLLLLPVVDAQGKLQGAITTRDIEKSRQIFDLKEYLTIILGSVEDKTVYNHLKDLFSLGQPIDLKAREVMSVKIPKVLATDSLYTVSQSMVHEKQTVAVVVTPENTVVGLVSFVDLLKQL